ncbi:hypothetical protein [Halorussus aquaticus]|uniref:Uncharacterized protein n=1 Tax=Halorussus aquaticus TaxID=2953748 RepID=A0ABD5Q0V0_9EURY|nr:hypothetical protein [Halorussus aquaticus]
MGDVLSRVSLLGVVTLLAVHFELLFVSKFGVAFWSWYFFALVGLSATYHWYTERKQRVVG